MFQILKCYIVNFTNFWIGILRLECHQKEKLEQLGLSDFVSI